MKLIKQLTDQHVYAEFLRAEWYKPWYDPYREQYNSIVLQPDITNSEHNAIRFDLLWRQKYPIVADIPDDTTWHLVSLEPAEFASLLIINEQTWRATFGNTNVLSEVAHRIHLANHFHQGVDIEKIIAISRNIGKHLFDEKLILVAPNTTAQPTILEGNHRATAFQLHALQTGQSDHIPVQMILGISKDMDSMQWTNKLH